MATDVLLIVRKLAGMRSCPLTTTKNSYMLIEVDKTISFRFDGPTRARGGHRAWLAEIRMETLAGNYFPEVVRW